MLKHLLNLDLPAIDNDSLRQIVLNLKSTLSNIKLDRYESFVLIILKLSVRTISDETVAFCIHHLQHLDDLSLMFCEQLTGDCLYPYKETQETELVAEPESSPAEEDQSEFASKPRKPDLSLPVLPMTSLYLGGNINVASTALSYFVQRTPLLKNLSIPALVTVNDSTLNRIGKCCPRLQHLNVSLCKKVSTLGVKMLTRRCHALKVRSALFSFD